ncbi:MAG: bifunctional UDP-N-acetylglucosamine diphosphorylase/glucosamine-1-phosphate N-acetyltransferase GlmU [Deltaproteobacteria bacterium]|nr:bifunctional UDP-N-acetylglucosamine diphosphorylase/glucosamine-1-phosphate N-acetyltransferase GlmU [Deltaproteobacteria bacterium]
MSQRNVTAIVLAAGLSTRMKSKTPKVLHSLCGQPVLFYPIKALKDAGITQIIVVVHPLYKREVGRFFGLRPQNDTTITFVEQKKPLGTADAVKTALKKIPTHTKKVLILCGDAPLISSSTVKHLLQFHDHNKADISFVSAEFNSESELGRVVRSAEGKVERIVEFRDASVDQKNLTEVNSGFYCVEPALLKKISGVKNANHKKEFYFTDLVSLIQKACALKIKNCEEIIGINTRIDLENARKALQKKINQRHMLAGVTLIDAESILIDQQVHLDSDVTIYPGTYLKGTVSIGNSSIVESHCFISNSKLAQNCHIKQGSIIEESLLEEGACVGPLAHLRPGTHLKQKAKIGNFVELKKTVLGKNSKANHLAYLGDALIGNDVNIGCGVITCNYDGFAKHKTIIEDGAFVGSDCQLVAPVRIGKGSYVGSGSTVTKNVPAGSLAIARGKQVNLEGYAKKIRNKMGKKTEENIEPSKDCHGLQ